MKFMTWCMPKNWLYKAGMLRQRDRNADMQYYLPGRFICAKDDSKLYDYIKYLYFNYIGGYEYNGRFSKRFSEFNLWYPF